jgi:hypothetical protein
LQPPIYQCYGRVLFDRALVNVGRLLIVFRQSQKGFDVALSFHSLHTTVREMKSRGRHGKNLIKGEDVAYEASFK